jgi:hypothetical protein
MCAVLLLLLLLLLARTQAYTALHHTSSSQLHAA